MSPIQTYIFMDLVTKHNEVTRETRIIRVSVVAENRSQYLESDDTVVSPEELTFRFYSDDNEPEFDKIAFSDFINFFKVQEFPVCFVCHNGSDIDFPLLKLQEQLQEFKVSLPNNVICADSLTAFRYILKNKNWKTNINSSASKNSSSEQEDNVREVACSHNLKEIYERVVTDPHIHGRPPETNSMMMFKISQVFGRFFITWVDQNHRSNTEENVKENKKIGKDRGELTQIAFPSNLKPSSSSLC